MRLKLKLLTLTALAVTSWLGVNAQEVCLTEADYAKINYSWIDAEGTPHTSKLTDIATDPYQIYELLREVYCNENVPGPCRVNWQVQN